MDARFHVDGERIKKKQDSDWKPMCQAEGRAERRMQTVTGNQCVKQKWKERTRQETGYAPIYRAEGGERREEGKTVIRDQCVMQKVGREKAGK